MKRVHHILFNMLRFLYGMLKYFILILFAYLIYQQLLSDILIDPIHITVYVILWWFTSYLVLPKITRLVTRLYVPSYFIGRTRTMDGLLGDPVNLAFQGEISQITEMFQDAGWSIADKLSFKSSCQIVVSTILNRPYLKAPVSSLYLFDQQQDIAFECEIGHSPRKRHHIRLWKVPDDYRLPGGMKVSWMGAATRDNHVGFSLFTGQITHKIDANTDNERDVVIESLSRCHEFKIQEFQFFTDCYRSRNGGGDQIYTDGTLKIIVCQDTTNKQAINHY